MTVIDQLNIFDNKTRANRGQYDLDTKNAEISALSSGEIEKYEYLTGEDLQIKPRVVSKTKFEYSPLGKAFNKVCREDKKDKRGVGYDNNLLYSSIHNFNKYSLSNFDEISSTDSKCGTINKFYKDLVKLDSVRIQSDKTKHKKSTVLGNATKRYYNWINRYKKEYDQDFENKDEDWRKKHNYKNLKEFDYQTKNIDELGIINEDKTDQELPKWIKVPRSVFNEIEDKIIEDNKRGLKTKIDKKEFIH